MQKDKLLSKELCKYPIMLVVGNPITKEQAYELIIRTSSLYYSTNDAEWEESLNEVIYGFKVRMFQYGVFKSHLGFTEEGNELYDAIYKYQKTISADLKILDLCYVTNCYKIATQYYYGPYGWCDWDGKIFSSHFSIGVKYPTCGEIYDEWVTIAEAFPFLDLKCQLVNYDYDGVYEKHPTIQFNIKGGKVKFSEPRKFITNIINRLPVDFNDRNHERGCTIEVFKDAVELIRNKYH